MEKTTTGRVNKAGYCTGYGLQPIPRLCKARQTVNQTNGVGVLWISQQSGLALPSSPRCGTGWTGRTGCFTHRVYRSRYTSWILASPEQGYLSRTQLAGTGQASVSSALLGSFALLNRERSEGTKHAELPHLPPFRGRHLISRSGSRVPVRRGGPMCPPFATPRWNVTVRTYPPVPLPETGRGTYQKTLGT